MSHSTFLTHEELHDLTGYQMPAAQIRWLKKSGWTFTISALNKPKVLRAYMEKMMGLDSQESAVQTDEPDFSHWKTAA